MAQLQVIGSTRSSYPLVARDRRSGNRQSKRTLGSLVRLHVPTLLGVVL